jgi:hypothetical protein
MSKRRFAITLLTLLLAIPAFPATVCVLVIESGIAPDAPFVEASSAWEAGIMDALFDAGHIVCNANAARAEQSGLPDRTYGWDAAREGGAEYVAVISLDYAAVPASASESNKRIRISPRAVSYRLAVVDGKSILEGEAKNLPPAASGDEDSRNALAVARLITAELKGR